MSTDVVSKKLKFKGDKPKKKKRPHREKEEDGDLEFAALTAADPRGASSHSHRGFHPQFR